MKERWYRANFDIEINGETHYPDFEYFIADDDEAAINHAKHFLKDLLDYDDVERHVKAELVSVTLIDNYNNWNDIKIIFKDYGWLFSCK